MCFLIKTNLVLANPIKFIKFTWNISDLGCKAVVFLSSLFEIVGPGLTVTRESKEIGRKG